MTPKDKSNLNVGQLLCGGFEGTGVTSQAYHLIVDHNISTMIVSKKNAESVKQMTKLIRDLQYIAYTQGKYKYPLMFAIDQEGGVLNTLFDSEYLTQFPGAMALSAIGDTEIVYEVLKALALELKQIGFHIIFGPVLDVVTKLSHQLVGVRSFGTNVADVIKNGRACARGFRDAGMLTFGKHFPGIGNASVDSLLELPMLADSLDQIKHFNAVPFAELIKEDTVDGISAAGCGVPTISPDEIHACLSPVLINQLLRTELGFNGVVISECLEMDALHHSIGLGQGVILALYAGCDLILLCHECTLQDEAVESMRKALTNGNLDEEIVITALSRIEVLQRKLPLWTELFPKGEESAKSEDLHLFKDIYPDVWQKHQELSALAYRGSITLVRDFPDALPITKFLNKDKRSNTGKKSNNILLLTPLLNPVSKLEITKSKDSEKEAESQLYNGEDVFKEFGNLLAEHPFNKETDKPYNVLHTTYTANGLTTLHEKLIEVANVVIVVTSEASRNMYQIGIVKYVSVLCGANPTSFNNAGQTYSQLSKPLILVASSSPYDFFYNKSIGSAYLCCYDYTHNALKELVGVLMGDCTAEGCIPGEKKYISRSKKRRLTEETNPSPYKGKKDIRRRWLVDEFDLDRDWNSLMTLIKNSNFENVNDGNLSTDKKGAISYQNDNYYKNVYNLLLATKNTQKHFVVRNSSLNILYGAVLTWVKESTTNNNEGRTGSIMYLLVDKTKRIQSIGKNLHARAMRYLVKEQLCSKLSLGAPFPLLVLPNNSNLLTGSSHNKIASFFSGFGWQIPEEFMLKKKHIMLLNDLATWQVPQKIFRELMIVGVRFDICNDPEKLINLLNRSNEHIQQETGEQDEEAILDEEGMDNDDKLYTRKAIREENEFVQQIYQQAISCLNNDNPDSARIIIALEPTNQTVIGSVILFTSRSLMAMFYPFMEESISAHMSPTESPISGKDSCVGGIVGPVIDPSYSNLTEIFKYGLICSGITLLKNDPNNSNINQCLMIGINDEKSGNINGIKEIGFQEWKYYYDYYDKTGSLTNLDTD